MGSFFCGSGFSRDKGIRVPYTQTASQNGYSRTLPTSPARTGFMIT